MKKVIAAILILVSTLFTVSEVSVFAIWFLPLIMIQMFQSTGISIETGSTLATFATSDAILMFMMWVVPCLFVLGLGLYFHCKFIRLVIRKDIAWLKVIFARKVVSEETKSEKNKSK